MDFLIDFHDVDFQWGNHDIVWMGAAAGNVACIANLLRMKHNGDNIFDMLEIGYGINLRPLAVFGRPVLRRLIRVTYFKPKVLDETYNTTR